MFQIDRPEDFKLCAVIMRSYGYAYASPFWLGGSPSSPARRAVSAPRLQPACGRGARVFGVSRSGTAPQDVEPISCDPPMTQRCAARSTTSRGDTTGLMSSSTPPASACRRPAPRMSSTDSGKPLATDLTGVYATFLAAYPLLKKAGSSSVINVTSINAVRGFPGRPAMSPPKPGCQA